MSRPSEAKPNFGGSARRRALGQRVVGGGCNPPALANEGATGCNQLVLDLGAHLPKQPVMQPLRDPSRADDRKAVEPGAEFARRQGVQINQGNNGEQDFVRSTGS